MQKVYLLLRNNQQTGPHSFEELLELHLKPYDLIWVEGKSLGWRYPTEIETLKPFFATPEPVEKKEAASKPIETIPPAIPVNWSKKIFVSMPATASPAAFSKETVVDPIEQKAEELRKKVEAFTSHQTSVQTHYTRNLSDAEEDYTKWICQKKTKKISTVDKRALAVVAICILLIAGGWWAGSSFFNSSSPKTKTISQQPIEKFTEPTIIDETITNDETITKENISLPENEGEVAPAKNVASTKINKKETSENKIISEEKHIVPEITEPENPPIEGSPDKPVLQGKEEEIIQQAPAEKKKTFKEKINDLLKKRKSDEGTAGTETIPTDNKNGQRTATHRGEPNEQPPVLTDVSDQVEIKTNKIADSWMMGVKNLKLTLVNRSNLTITAAKIEVIYLSDQNTVLEKKILSYTNIAPNKSQTVPAPDQRLADHIEYKVLSATGIENAYANN